MKYGTRIEGTKDKPEVWFYIGQQAFQLNVEYRGTEQTPKDRAKWYAQMVEKALDNLANAQPTKDRCENPIDCMQPKCNCRD